VNKPEKHNVPKHVAIIMDGNGRWAKARGLERSEGHRFGAETVKTIVKAAAKAGVKYLTLYAFSTENWKRPKEEIDAIMDLLVFMLERETEDLMKNGVRLLCIGDIKGLSEKAQQSLNKSIRETSKNDRLTLVIALNYGARNEILNAVINISKDIANKHISHEQIDESLFEKYLYTADIPDPDLLIRTSGEQRISNFLLWQLAYTELYFTSVPWPDFSETDFNNAINTFSERERRFGMTKEQVIIKQDKID
jgi:undecaprenyl diphosphate synthase